MDKITSIIKETMSNALDNYYSAFNSMMGIYKEQLKQFKEVPVDEQPITMSCFNDDGGPALVHIYKVRYNPENDEVEVYADESLIECMDDDEPYFEWDTLKYFSSQIITEVISQTNWEKGVKDEEADN
jgi:hypothetical protein